MVVKDQIIGAYKELLTKDAHLLTVDANERSITHCFATYLQEAFPDYNVDCEYNRNGLEPKKLDSFKRHIESDDTEGVSVYPDIIIHHRGTSDNFIVIEAKKTSSSDEMDIEKLRAYKSDLAYTHSYFIRFPVGRDFSQFDEASLADHIQEIS